MTALPAAWTTRSLGDICLEMRNGISTKPIEDAGVAILRISAVRPMKLDSSDVRFLPEEMAGVEPYKLRTDDLLFTRYNGNRELVGACARVRHVNRDLVYPDKLIRVRVDSRVASPGFVEAVSNSADAREYIDRKLKTSAGQVGISGADLKGLPILLPPLREQQRIVAKLNTLLGRVDACRERLERVGPLIKRFRQSVLAAAVRGDLTEDWRCGQPFETREVVFADMVSESTVGLVRSAPEQGELNPDRTAYLKMNNIGESWGLASFPQVGVSVSGTELKRYQLRKDDWLFNTRNSVELVGKSCVWPGGQPTVFNNNILRVRFIDTACPQFVEIWFRSPSGQATLRKIKSATTSVAAIYQGSLMAVRVDLPAKAEQVEVARRVSQLLSLAESLEVRLRAAKQAANRLTPATLAKAFRGELVPQDPNDEPASALLARLRESAAPPATGATGPRPRGRPRASA